MFSSHTIHRRKKIGWATERGAAGFLIANTEPGGGPVCGSSGRAGGPGIPAAATNFESSLSLANQEVRLILNGTDHESTTDVLILELPGRSENWVVLSAHVDGHDLAESALDNATGVAVALAVTRVLAPHVKDCEQGLRLCLFSAEEWALAGSKQYLDRMSQAGLDRMQMNINLDTVAGDSNLTALTSDFPALDAWVKKVARENGLELGTYLPTMQSSDHFHFARHGIPALRLVAGFDRRESSVQHVLTPLDRRNKARAAQLSRAGRVTAILAWNALTLFGEQLTR
jgi:Iap family predicted aminopeptidase